MLGKRSSFVRHMREALANRQSNYRSYFRYVVAARPGAACLGVAGGAAQKNSNTLSLPLLHRSYTLASIQVAASFTLPTGRESLHFKPVVACRKRPASNHSIERTVKGLRPSPAAHVKR